jgi:hypothetical protein
MSADPYLRLAELAETEQRLVEEGHLEQLEPHYEEATAIVATLPERPPESAREPLERAARAQEAVAALLGTGLAETRAELGRLRRGRDLASAYGAAGR